MRAFTLLELLVVLIIVGILAGLAIPNYTKTSERAKDREAQTALSLIQAGERMYQLRAGDFISCADTNAVNTNLKLSLTSQAWNYSITATSGPDTFLATATRIVGGRTCQIDQDDSEASCP